MQHKLAKISNWYIIVMLIVMPPIGYYFAMKYREAWVKARPWFTVLVILYFIVIVTGLTLSGVNK